MPIEPFTVGIGVILIFALLAVIALTVIERDKIYNKIRKFMLKPLPNHISAALILGALVAWIIILTLIFQDGIPL